MRPKVSHFLAAAAGGMALAGLYTWWQLKQLTPAKPRDALDAGRIMLDSGTRILAFSAHPDDLELFAGGILRRLHQEGHEITVVTATDGEKSRWMQDLAPKRQREQKKAGQIIGYDQVRLLHLGDGTLAKRDNLTSTIKGIIAEVSPHVVLAFDYVHFHRWFAHPDHQALGEAVVHAVNELDSDCLVYLYGSKKPSVTVDITSVIRQKIWAVPAHKSQLRFGNKPATVMVRQMARLAAKGSPFRFAESFRALHNIHTFVPPRINVDPHPPQPLEHQPTDGSN